MPSPVQTFAAAKAAGTPLAIISLYDAPTAQLCADAGCGILLVGDSLGNVVLGYEGTQSVTMDDMCRHTGAVARGAKKSSRPDAIVIADMPFGSYATVESAVSSAVLLARAGAHSVKLEGAGPAAIAAIEAISGMGLPVMGHLGYTPQASLSLSGVVQGKTARSATELMDAAQRLETAGCYAVVLEAVAVEVAADITQRTRMSTIGIGAGPGCDGQVLVWHDLAGMSSAEPFRFVKRFGQVHENLEVIARAYLQEVRGRDFPSEAHGWAMASGELSKWRAGADQGSDEK